MSLMLDFPAEIKDYAQWYVSGSGEKSPQLYCQTDGFFNVKPTPINGYSFIEAMQIQEMTACDIGFYLSQDDPYCCIDLDVKNEHNWANPDEYTTPEELARYSKIVEYFDSYTEASWSGQGVHIWIKGSIGAGKRREGVEVYSQERFIVCTGSNINSKGVNDRQAKILTFIDELTSCNDDHIGDLVEVPSPFTDEEIYLKLMAGANSVKFSDLWAGNWQKHNYPSQSEADISLLSMFTFYSVSNEQCRRLFRLSGLRREKTSKNDYHLDRMLAILRNRLAVEKMEHNANAELAKSVIARLNKANAIPREPAVVGFKDKIKLGTREQFTLEYPLGTMGELAKFIYGSSVRPSKIISIASALGIMAGICGKAWNIPMSGLNLYIVLIARSAVGKEALNSAVSDVSAHLKKIPSLMGSDKFFKFNTLASGPALTKAVVANPCFLHINGEFGRQLKQLSIDNPNSPAQQLRTTLTHLYQKSGHGSAVGGLEYSNKDDNVDTVNGVAYSMIGETTPDKFYESLTRDMMEDGFLSRFIMISHIDGERPPTNQNLVPQMSNQLLEKLEAITRHALTNIAHNVVTMVDMNTEAKSFLDGFDKECDKAINATLDEGIRQIWNRAHLKTLRIAAILAVCDNHIEPVISIDNAKWAYLLIRSDMQVMFSKIKDGDVGSDDNSRINKMVSFIREYAEGTASKVFISKPELREMGIITRSDIQRKMGNIASYRTSHFGATAAIDKTLAVLCDMGLISATQGEITSEFTVFKGKAFHILPDLLEYYETELT